MALPLPFIGGYKVTDLWTDGWTDFRLNFGGVTDLCLRAT